MVFVCYISHVSAYANAIAIFVIYINCDCYGNWPGSMWFEWCVIVQIVLTFFVIIFAIFIP